MRFLLAGFFSCLLLSGAAPKPQDCIGCHDVDLAKFEKTPHASMGCTGCHGSITKLPHTGKPAPVKCADCHADEVKNYAGSVHGMAKKQGMADAATCASCHGSPHELLPTSDPASRVAKPNLPDTCGSCHSNPDFMAKHKIPFAKPVEAYRLSLHGREVAKGNMAAASCSDCHGSHTILPATDPRAKVNHANVMETCGACHVKVKAAYEQSVHGVAVAQGATDAPTCTDCHGEHSILAPSEAGSLVNPARVSTVTCGRCHADERLARRYDLPASNVISFEDSFHGLALRGGQQTVANCASCHGVHDILPSSDPRSTINPKNLGRTCGQCHTGVGDKLATARIHLRNEGADGHPVVKWIRLAYLLLIPLTIGFMLLHNGLDFLRKLRHRKSHHGSGEEVMRMNIRFRIAHWMVIVSFITLVFTGFALKFPESAWVKVCQSCGLSPIARAYLHRIAAILITFGTVYHLVHMAMVRRDRVILGELLPNWQDAKDIFNMLRYNLGLTKHRPTFGMFGYPEKMEYWAFMWGTVVMAVTGFLLWAENWTLSHFPKWVIDAATAAHWYEAILATLSILVWHWYLVIFDPDVYPMDMAWLNGKVPADHLRETRPEYYRRIVEASEAQDSDQAAPPDGPSSH
jgi:formate dehydrogenase gamma subunit